MNQEMKNSKNLMAKKIKVWSPNMVYIGSYKREFAETLVDDGFAYLETTEDIIFY